MNERKRVSSSPCSIIAMRVGENDTAILALMPLSRSLRSITSSGKYVSFIASKNQYSSRKRSYAGS